jgi:hypothetical protein
MQKKQGYTVHYDYKIDCLLHKSVDFYLLLVFLHFIKIERLKNLESISFKNIRIIHFHFDGSARELFFN